MNDSLEILSREPIDKKSKTVDTKQFAKFTAPIESFCANTRIHLVRPDILLKNCCRLTRLFVFEQMIPSVPLRRMFYIMSKPTVPPPPCNRHIRKLMPYPPGKPIEEVQREFGLDSVVKLASNENPLGPSPRAVKAMHSAATEMHLYPDGAGFYLKQALADRLGVAPEEIILGNGSDEITTFLGQCYLGPRRGLVTSEYAFIRYKMAAEAAGAPTTVVKMKNMRHDLAAMAKAIDPRTAMICLDVPCNPTGCGLSSRTLIQFLNRVPSETIVLLDQAYHEYAAGTNSDCPDGLVLRDRFPNLVVARTFSKAYGLAGLRIGYAVARREIVGDLDRIRPPFNANRMAQAAALAALDDKAHLRRAIQANARGMKQLEEGFQALGLKSWPSQANFILVDVGGDGREVFHELLKLGVVTRPMAGYGLTRCLRISIGTAAENRRCLNALGKVL